MSEIGVFTPEQARLLWQDYQERRQLAPQLQHNFPQRRPIDEPSPHRVFIQNVSGETMPAYGCGQITGTTVVGGRTVVTVTKPTSTDGEYLINSQFAIADDGCGWAFRYGVVIFTGTAAGSVTEFRPVVSSWNIEEGSGPFLIFGAHDVVTNGLIGRFASDARLFRFTLNGDLLSGTADADILYMNGIDTGIDDTVRDPLGIFELLETGDAGLCLRQNGKYWVIQAPCPLPV